MKKFLLLLGSLALAAVLLWKVFAGASGPESAALTPLRVPSSIAEQATRLAENHKLELVNASHAVSGRPMQLVSAYPTVPVRETSITLQEEALEALKSMFDAAKAEGIEGLFLSSGYRDYDTQKQIYKEATDKSLVQPAGHSEHQTGLAADILALEVTQERMGSSKQGQWLAQNAWRFGFILRYPEGKESVTGIAYEPWHFRYIGHPHAQVCYENKLCLEEYILYLSENNGIINGGQE